MKIQEIKLIAHTNQNLATWYINAKIDYSVNGCGCATIEGDKFIINYVENGEAKKWITYYHIDYLNNGINFLYNIWCEEAQRINADI